MATSTQTQHQVRNYSVGRYLDAATAGAFTITCGFKPRYVRIINTETHAEEEWFEGMTAGTSIKKLVAGTGVTGTTGITVSNSGFTVGLDPDVLIINQQLSWIAIG